MKWQCVFESFPVTCFQQNIIKHTILLERSIQVISFRIVFWILMPKHYQCYKERSQHWDESTYNKSDFLDFSIFISISKLTSEYKLSSFVTKNIERHMVSEGDPISQKKNWTSGFTWPKILRRVPVPTFLMVVRICFSGDNFEILSLFPLTVFFFGAISSTMIISK